MFDADRCHVYQIWTTCKENWDASGLATFATSSSGGKTGKSLPKKRVGMGSAWVQRRDTYFLDKWVAKSSMAMYCKSSTASVLRLRRVLWPSLNWQHDTSKQCHPLTQFESNLDLTVDISRLRFPDFGISWGTEGGGRPLTPPVTKRRSALEEARTCQNYPGTQDGDLKLRKTWNGKHQKASEKSTKKWRKLNKWRRTEHQYYLLGLCWHLFQNLSRSMDQDRSGRFIFTFAKCVPWMFMFITLYIVLRQKFCALVTSLKYGTSRLWQ